MDKPATLGRFRIERQLGRGAMGVVYVAEDPVRRRRVAIKAIHIHPGLTENHVEELRQRFVSEARAATNLSHPNIVTLYDAGFDGDSLFIAMELVEGECLADVLASGRLLTDEEISDLALQLGSALDYAHEHGVVHRDIRPANVLVDKHGKPKIADFGVARQVTSTLTATGTVIGTPAYMSPEQITGHAVTGAADQFSLGVVLYEMLTGRRPFRGDGTTAILYRIVHEEPEPPMVVRESLPPAVGRVVLRALAKDPAERFPSCTALAEALRAAFEASPAEEGDPLAADPTQPGSVAEVEAPPSALPLNLPTLLATGAAVVLVTFGLLWVLGGWEEPEPVVVEPSPPPATVSETYRIVSRPPGAQLTLDGRLLADRTPVEVRLDVSSRHTLRLEMPGRESVSWAFVPEALPDEQRSAGQLFFPLRDASVSAAEEAAALASTPPEPEPLEPYDPVKLDPARDTRPTVVERVEPEFPDWAATQGLQHYVILRVVIDKHGRVRDSRVLKPVHPDLERLARQAILRWRFTPAYRDGDESQPFDVYHNVSVQFHVADGGRS